MFRIVEAQVADVPVILQFIRHLAVYEKLENEVRATEEQLRTHLFGPEPAASVVFAEQDGRKIGFALYFVNFSTFLAKPGIYLEDLFVLPEARGAGAGKQLLAHLARLVIARGYGRLDWAVLDWNAPSIAFYDGLGAKPLDDWITYRLTGEALRNLAR